MLGGDAVLWVSRKQLTIVTSSTQTEYMALYHASKNLLWDRGYFSQLDRAHYIRKDSHSMTIYIDNQSAMKIAISLQISDRSKHFDILYHAIQEWVRFTWISLTYVATTNMITDGLTKPLEKQKHDKAVTMMGLIRMDEEELTTQVRHDYIHRVGVSRSRVRHHAYMGLVWRSGTSIPDAHSISIASTT